MTTHKQIEQQLKRPDTFQDTVLKGINYVSNNKARVALMLAPIVAVTAAFYGVYGWQQRQSAHRRADLAKIIAMQTDESNSVGKQTEAIQKEIDALRKAVPAAGADAKKPALSAETLLKIGELEKKLSSTKPDHAGSTQAFRAFYDAHPDKAEGWMAGVSWASSQFEAGKAVETRSVIEQIVKASTTNKFYQIQSRFMLANILEEQGEYDAALKEADILNGLVEDDSKPMVMLLKGQLLYFKKDNAASRTVLSEIIEKHGSTREAQTARSLLAQIGPA